MDAVYYDDMDAVYYDDMDAVYYDDMDVGGRAMLGAIAEDCTYTRQAGIAFRGWFVDQLLSLFSKTINTKQNI
ncbi:hypothetical protein ND16A_2951 [Thalassotalea sp. ND16A]|nr:hypothetical protein ND16A_2951 [Thalassotalea sp. ND16A]